MTRRALSCCALSLAGVALSACGDAGHLGNPALLPVAGAVTAVENAAYGSRRSKVKAYLTKNRTALMAAHTGAEPVAAALWQIAGVHPQDGHHVLLEMQDVQAADWFEAATIVVMVHAS